MDNKKGVLSSKIINVNEYVLLAVISAVFLVFSFMNLKHVGVGLDETLYGHWGAYVLENRDFVFSRSFNLHPAKLFFGGMYFPACLPNYMLLPFFLLFGVNIFALKFMPIFLAWLTLLMLYFVLKAVFNKEVALTTNVLLCISPLFIHYARTGLEVMEPMLNFFFIGSIFFMLIFIKKSKNIYLCVSAFLFGCGFSVFFQPFRDFLA